MLFEEFLTWAFWVQDVGPGLVKNDKKGCFHTTHHTINRVFPKHKDLTATVS